MVMIAAGGSAAEAATVVTMPLTSTLNSGQHVDAAFDLSSFLKNAQGEKFALTNASVTVNGYSAPGINAELFTGYQYGNYTAYRTEYWSYRCGLSTCYRAVQVPYTVYTSYPIYTPGDATVDTLSVNVANITSTSQTPYSAYGIPGHYGNVATTVNVSGTSLDAANASGLLAFSVTAYATNAGIRLNNATVSFDLAQISSAVPEPASWAMMIGGFAVIGGVLRRRSKVGRSLTVA